MYTLYLISKFQAKYEIPFIPPYFFFVSSKSNPKTSIKTSLKTVCLRLQKTFDFSFKTHEANKILIY